MGRKKRPAVKTAKKKKPSRPKKADTAAAIVDAVVKLDQILGELKRIGDTLAFSHPADKGKEPAPDDGNDLGLGE